MLPALLTPGTPVNVGGMVYGPLGQKIVPVYGGTGGPGSLSDAPPWFNEDGRTTVQNALSLMRANRGDMIQLLPGHTETLSSATSWSNLAAAGVTIMGPQSGPPAVFTWSAATSAFAMAQNDFVIDGGPNRSITLLMEPGAGTVTVAAPITVTGARCKIRNCNIRVGTDVNNVVTNAITLGAGATDFVLENNFIYAGAAAVITTVLTASGDNNCSRLRVNGNYISAEVLTAGTGVLLDISAAATAGNSINIQVNGNFLNNRTASSVFVGKFAATTGGECSYNRIKVDSTATAITSEGFTPFGANNVLVGYFQNRIVDDDGLADGLQGTAST